MQAFSIRATGSRRNVLNREAVRRRLRKASQARDAHLIAGRPSRHPEANIDISLILAVRHFARQQSQMSLVQPVSSDAGLKGWLEFGKIGLPAFAGNRERRHEI